MHYHYVIMRSWFIERNRSNRWHQFPSRKTLIPLQNKREEQDALLTVTRKEDTIKKKTRKRDGRGNSNKGQSFLMTIVQTVFAEDYLVV